MRIISVSTLKAFYEQPRYAASEQTIKTWISVTRNAQWANPMDVKADYGQADILQDGRVIFDLGGNKFRLVAYVHYAYRTVYVRFIGTHAQYDAIDPQTV